MLRVGLTGGIGSGKSEVARRLAEHGAVLIDADVAAREVVVPGSPGLAQVAAAFGDEVLRPDGSLNRERLGEIVFADPGLRGKLNAIVHPLVREWMQEAERAAVQTDSDAIVVHDVPLLAESRGKAGFDAVIVVDVPADLQDAIATGREPPNSGAENLHTMALVEALVDDAARRGQPLVRHRGRGDLRSACWGGGLFC